MRAQVVVAEGRLVCVMFDQQKPRRFGIILVNSEMMAVRFRFEGQCRMAHEPVLELPYGVRPAS
jgi:hypothetical protein